LAADCHADIVAAEVGHMPPKIYILVCEAFARTNVEKLNPVDKKFAPGRAADVTSPAVFVVCCSQVPFPMALVLEGVNLHSAELWDVEQEPVYTDISPMEEIDGMKAVESSLVKGRFGVML
jgi:hypothetical protein